MLGKLGYYILMCALFGWNLFNLLRSTGSVYSHAGLLGAVPYALLCLVGMGFCISGCVWRYNRDKKRKCQSCEK